MTVRFYMDEHVSRAVTVGLRRRGLDVLTVQEDGRTGASDPAVLDRATELGRVLFSQDELGESVADEAFSPHATIVATADRRASNETQMRHFLYR